MSEPFWEAAYRQPGHRSVFGGRPRRSSTSCGYFPLAPACSIWAAVTVGMPSGSRRPDSR